MSRYEEFDTSVHDLEFKGKKYAATIVVKTWQDDVMSIDDLIDSKAFPDQAERLERDLNSGNASVLSILVVATCPDLPDLKGTDSLGGVIVYNRKDVDNTVKDHSMIENALSDLVASYDRELTAARDKVKRLENV